MKLFISIKHDLIIGRDMPKTRRQKFDCCYFFRILGLKNDLIIKQLQRQHHYTFPTFIV